MNCSALMGPMTVSAAPCGRRTRSRRFEPRELFRHTDVRSVANKSTQEEIGHGSFDSSIRRSGGKGREQGYGGRYLDLQMQGQTRRGHDPLPIGAQSCMRLYQVLEATGGIIFDGRG